jgi:hypothetical protein
MIAIRFLCMAACIGALAGCNYQGPALAGYPGLQLQVQNYYDARAWEENATCLAPRMQAVTQTEILEDTPERILMRLRYYYQDDQFGPDDSDFVVGNPFRCRGFADRTFEFVKRADGTAQVVGMSGPQRS